MQPRHDVGEERRNQIFEAAIKVFTRLGYHKANVDDIAREAGLSKGGLYWHFKSKNEILVGILRRLLSHEETELLALREAEGTAKDRLLQATAIVLTGFKQIRGWVPLMYEYVALGLRDEKIRAMLATYAEAVKDILAPIVQQGVERGEFRPVDTGRATVALMSIMEGTVLMRVVVPETVDIERQMLFGVKLLLERLEIGDPAVRAQPAT